MAALKSNGRALSVLVKNIEDPKFVLAAVLQNGLALKCASEALRNDREVVLAAVKSHGWALQFASEEFRKDRKIVLAAMKEDLFACKSSLLGHKETKALLKEISLEKYVSLGELGYQFL